MCQNQVLPGHHSAVRKKLLKSERIPTLCQYDPHNRFLDIHAQDHTLVVTCVPRATGAPHQQHCSLISLAGGCIALRRPNSNTASLLFFIPLVLVASRSCQMYYHCRISRLLFASASVFTWWSVHPSVFIPSPACAVETELVS